MGDNETRCRECGKGVDRMRFGDLCASCLLDDACDHPPADFAGYELIEEIARGGMGVVYRARQMKPEREVALKCLSGSLLPGEELKALFEVEAVAMATLEHPAVLPVYHFGEADGFPFFTMKLAGGGSLAKRLDALAGDWRAITRILLEICDVVRYLHERGMLHRDIKPGNILFDDSGRVYLADFGIARLIAADPAEAILRSGTPAYLAPEVARREDYTALSELWSLGAVMWEMLHGKPPFRGENPAELLSRINESPPEVIRADAPADLVAVARKLLEKNPRDRYASVAEVEGELKSWLAGNGVLARPRGVIERFVRCAWRNPLLSALSCGLVLLAIWLVVSQLRSHAQLRESYGISLLHQSRNLRAMHRHEEALEQIVEASSYLKAPHAADLRTEAAAIFAYPGWREISRIGIRNAEMTGSETFTPDLGRFLMAESDGLIGIRDIHTGKLLETIPTGTESPVLSIATGRDTALVVARHLDGTHGIHGKNGFPPLDSGTAIYLLPDSERILHLHPDHGAWIGTPADPFGKQIAEAPLASTRAVVDPTGEKVLIFPGIPHRVEIRSLDEGEILARLDGESGEPGAAAFSPDAGLIAVCSRKAPFSTHIHDAATGLTIAEFADHRAAVSKIAWHPSGDSIATVANSENLVWRSISPGGWRHQRPATSRALAFSSDGGRLGYCPADGSLAILELSATRVFQTYVKPTTPADPNAYRFNISPDGKWLAVSESSGIRLWNHEERVQTDDFRFGQSHYWGDLGFTDDSRSIRGFGLDQGIWEMDIRDGKLAGFRHLGEKGKWIIADFLTDGRSLLVMEARKAENGAWIWRDSDPGQARKVSEGFTMVGLRNIPGTETGYSSHWSEPDIWVWDFATGKRTRRLGLSQPCAAEPSPDGRWLLVSTASETHLFKVSSWEKVASWPTQAGKHEVFTTSFSGDGTLVAQGKPDGSITLRAVPTGERIVTLLPPTAIRLQQIRFHQDRLIVLASTGEIVQWDLVALRQKLASLGLDW